MNSVEPIRLSDIDQIEGTRVFCGSTDDIFKLVEETTSRAAADIEDPCSNFVCDKFGLKLALSALKFREKFRKEIQLKHPNYKVRLLVDIQNENLEFVKQLLLVSEPQLEVRHLEGIKANFYVTRKDFVCYPLSLEVGDPQELIWSTSPMTIAQMLNVFQYLWNSGVAAEYRIKQLEQNREVGEVNLLTNPSEIRQKYIGLAESSNSEVLIAAVSERSVLRNREDIALLSRRAERENVTPSEDREDIKREKLRMRILIPSEDSSSGSMIKEMLGEFEYRKIESIPISFGVFDRREALLIQYGREETDEDAKVEQVVSSAIHTTNRQMVSGLVSVFDALWRQSEMLSEINELRKNEQESTSSLKFVNEVINCLQIMTLGNDLLLAEIEKVQGGDRLRPVLDSMQSATTRLSSFLDAHRKK